MKNRYLLFLLLIFLCLFGSIFNFFRNNHDLINVRVYNKEFEAGTRFQFTASSIDVALSPIVSVLNQVDGYDPEAHYGYLNLTCANPEAVKTQLENIKQTARAMLEEMDPAALALVPFDDIQILSTGQSVLVAVDIRKVALAASVVEGLEHTSLQVTGDAGFRLDVGLKTAARLDDIVREEIPGQSLNDGGEFFIRGSTSKAALAGIRHILGHEAPKGTPLVGFLLNVFNTLNLEFQITEQVAVETLAGITQSIRNDFVNEIKQFWQGDVAEITQGFPLAGELIEVLRNNGGHAVELGAISGNTILHVDVSAPGIGNVIDFIEQGN